MFSLRQFELHHHGQLAQMSALCSVGTCPLGQSDICLGAILFTLTRYTEKCVRKLKRSPVSMGWEKAFCAPQGYRNLVGLRNNTVLTHHD